MNLCVELEGVTTEVAGVVVKTDGLGNRLALRLALTLLVTELEFDCPALAQSLTVSITRHCCTCVACQCNVVKN